MIYDLKTLLLNLVDLEDSIITLPISGCRLSV